MAFLDNSGDIVLDAVLTDAGRQRMARGEFKIVKFAFADEEVNYQLYDPNHPSGSAFSDLQIMQTPILEAFTNNTSLMKTKLISLSRNNILYMPIFRLNNTGPSKTTTFSAQFEGYYLTADSGTTNKIDFQKPGIFPGHNVGPGGISGKKTQFIYVDQGMDTGGVPTIQTPMPADLIETAFLVRIDDRLLQLHSSNGVEGEHPILARSFVDDDAIATYYISSTSPASQPPRTIPGQEDATYQDAIDKEVFDGPLGTRLRLMLQPSNSIKQSQALFNELGAEGTNLDTITKDTGTNRITAHKYIDTVLNVVGVTTGYSIDIPIRIIKDTST